MLHDMFNGCFRETAMQRLDHRSTAASGRSRLGRAMGLAIMLRSI